MGDRKLLEAQCKDAQQRVDEAEQNALKGGKKAMLKMESRVRELESELDAENRRLGDGLKNLRKSERKIKEPEEIAALNLAKFRKAQGALGDAEANADANEATLAKFKARARSASLGPV